MKTVVFERSGSTLVIVQSDQQPLDEEWDALVERCTTVDFRAQLTWTDGGAPTNRQRLRLRQALRDKGQPLALLTNDRVARGVLSVMSLFFKGLKAFPFSARDEAMDFLQIPPAERAEALATLERLRLELQQSTSAAPRADEVSP